jgi:hypothetical protein
MQTNGQALHAAALRAHPRRGLLRGQFNNEHFICEVVRRISVTLCTHDAHLEQGVIVVMCKPERGQKNARKRCIRKCQSSPAAEVTNLD